MENFNLCLGTWMQEVEQICNDPEKTWGSDMERVSIVASYGKNYVRVVRTAGTSISTYAFIEISTGNIYKPKGWKSPEKNFTRGNIFDDTTRGRTFWCGPYGIMNAR